MQGFILQPYGWRGAFWIAVALPAALLPVIHIFLPESLRARAARNPDDPGMEALAQRMLPAGAVPVRLTAMPRSERTAMAILLSDILGPGQRTKTFLMWAIAISSFVFITAGVWKTTIFKNVIGLSWQQVALVNGTDTVAGFIGMLSIGFFIDRFGFKRVMVSTFFLAAIGAVLVGALAPSMVMMVAVALMAACQHGGQASIAALAAALYPARSRATGVGWAYGAGRVASIFAPLFGTFVLTEGFGPAGIFAMLGVPLVSAGIFTFLLMSAQGAPQVVRAGHGRD